MSLAHSSVRPLACSFEGCDLKFITRQHLKRHESLHQEPRPFHCEYDTRSCIKTFRKKSQLRDHIAKDHLEGQNFPCTELRCKCTFASGSELETHVNKKHANKRSHTCQAEGCSMVFEHLSQLKNHIAEMHKPVCSICAFTTKGRKLLKAHLKTHESDLEDRRQFVCTVEGCSARFTRVGQRFS